MTAVLLFVLFCHPGPSGGEEVGGQDVPKFIYREGGAARLCKVGSRKC